MFAADSMLVRWRRRSHDDYLDLGIDSYLQAEVSENEVLLLLLLLWLGWKQICDWAWSDYQTGYR